MVDKIKKNTSKKGAEKELTPDELADKILGLVDETGKDEDVDLEASKFWYEAAYKDELEQIFKEKNRMRVLVDALIKRGYSETEINDLFINVRKQKYINQRESEEAIKKTLKIQSRIFQVCVIMIAVFVLYQIWYRTAILRQQQIDRIRQERSVLTAETDHPFFSIRKPEQTQWKIISGREPFLRQGMSVRSEQAGTHKILFSDVAYIEFSKGADFNINAIELDDEFENISTVVLQVNSGFYEWIIPESLDIDIRLDFAGGSLNIGYGEGKIEASSEPLRIAIREGENRVSIQGERTRSLNGLHELLLEDPPVIQIYDLY